MRWSFERRAALAFSLVLLLIIVMGATAYDNGQQFIATNQRVAHTLEVLGELEEARSILFNAETAQRGYLITGDETYLTSFDAALTNVLQNLQTLRTLIADNPVQVERLNVLDTLVADRIVNLERSLETYQAEGFTAAQQIVMTGEGRNLMDEIRVVIDEMSNEEQSLLTTRRAAAEATIRRTFLVFAIFTTIASGSMLAVYYLINRNSIQQKKAAQEISESEELLRLLINHLPETVFVKDSASRFLLVNNAVLKQLGVNSEEQVIGKTDFEFHSRDEAERYQADEKDIINSGQAKVNYEEEVFDHSRHGTRWLVSSKIPIKDEQGKVTRLVGVNHDITERKRTEARFKGLLEAAPDAMVIVNRQGIIVLVNAQAQKLFGYNGDELIGHSIDMLVPSRFAAHHPDYRDGYFNDPHTRSMGVGLELFALRKDGSEFPVEISLSPLETEEGMLVSSAIRDITERKQAEVVLRQYADELRDLYDNAPCGYHSLDEDGVFVQINATELRWLGYTREEIIGKKKFLELVTPDSAAVFKKNFPLFKERGWIHDLEFDLIRKDGTHLFVLLNATAVYDSEGTYLQSRSTLFDITDRKRSEAQISYQADLLRNVSDAIFAVNTDHTINYWNHAAEKVYGWKADEVLGKNARDLLRTEMRDDDRNSLLEELTGNIGHYIEFIQRRKDGTPIHIEGTTMSLRDARGTVTGYIAVNRDISERKRKEEQITYQAHLLANVNDAILATDSQYNITYWNRIAEEIYGWTREEAIGRSAPDLLRSEISDEQRVIIAQDLATKGHYRLELVRYRKDGTPIQIEGTTIIMHDDRGEVSGYISVSRDITKRKQREAQIRYQANLLENVNDAIYASDARFALTYWNRKAEEIYGYTSEEALGKDARALLRSIVTEEQRAYILQELAQRGGYHTEFVQHRKDGTPIHIESTMVTLYDDAQQVTGYVAVSRDISERKRVEQEIQALNAGLERRSMELQAANQELEAFSYSVSHDLRAPLRSIDGFSLALLEDYSDKLDSEGQAYLQRVRAATQRMARLIDDLLNLARTTRTIMTFEEVSLSAMAQTIADDLHDRQPERNVEFIIAPDLTAIGDKPLLRVVLDNLIGNAWKFTCKQPQARIEFGLLKQEADMSTYFVRDNGAGFDMAYVSKLFGAFQRLHAMTEFEGTGVGLATVKRIIHRHGGTIWAKSALEEGATFYFTLPMNPTSHT